MASSNESKPFAPTSYTLRPAAEAEAENSVNGELRACIGFLNRVATRFNGNGVYNKFLDCMDSVFRGEDGIFEVSNKVFKLFGKKHQDLAVEFRSFLPESCKRENIPSNDVDDQETRVQERLRKRKHIFANDVDDQETRIQERPRKRRNIPSNDVVDQETSAQERPCKGKNISGNDVDDQETRVQERPRKRKNIPSNDDDPRETRVRKRSRKTNNVRRNHDDQDIPIAPSTPPLYRHRRKGIPRRAPLF